MVTEAEYDIAQRVTLTLASPLVDLTPTTCFQVETFKVYDQATDEPVTEYLSIGGGATDGSLDIFSSDRSLVGTHDVYIMTLVLESQEEVAQ